MTLTVEARGAGSSAGAHGFAPILVHEVELSRPVEDVATSVAERSGLAYGRVHVLVRLHGAPLGTVLLDLPAAGLPAAALLAEIREQVGAEIDAHLAADGMPAGIPAVLEADGPVPPCRQDVEDVRAASDSPLVSVIVATYKRPELIVRCVRALLASDYPRFELLVVDNSPHEPATRAVVEETFGPESRVRYMAESEPGLSNARNHGMKFSRGELVAFTDDDVIVDPGWISSLVTAFASEPTAACVTGPIMPLELESPAQVMFEIGGRMSKGFHRRVFDMDRNRGDSPLYPYTVGQYGSGANMAMRKGMMGDLWQFDNTLGTGTIARGGEDLDCYLDVLLRGHSIVYEPRALVRHGHRSDHAALRVQMRHYGVGLSALITKRLLATPGARTDLLKRIPHGVRFALSSDSRQGARGHEGYPRDLLIQEWIGIAEGPFAYVRSRLRKAWLTS